MIAIYKDLIRQISYSLLVALFAGSLVYGQTAIVSGGNFGMGTYNYAGTTNVGGTDRQYFDLPSTTYRLEYRNNPSYGTEWEIWESTARSGTGIIRYFNLSTSVNPPATGWQLDVASGPLPTVAYTVPVELTSFIANVKDRYVELNWQTATEVNNYGFEVERRAVKSESSRQEAGGQATLDSWQKIGFVAGAGTSNAPKEYSYSDATVYSGKYVYRLKQIDQDGTFEYSQSVEVSTQLPEQTTLNQNYPNPFNPSTTIVYQLQSVNHVTLKVFDVLGKEVATLVNEVQQPGNKSVIFNASALVSGIYFYRLQSGSFSQTNKLILLK